jgi:hypothetical protein
MIHIRLYIIYAAICIISLFLLISGWFCHYRNDTTIIKQVDCERVFISGLFMTFLMGVTSLFGLLLWINDSCESSLRSSGS